MKRRGFTLAEVLITLGIIGVVAALTAPALVQNAGSAKVGPTLAKVVSSLENAHEGILTEQGANNLSAVASNSDEYCELLSSNIRKSSYGEGTLTEDDFSPTPKTWDNSPLFASLGFNYNTFKEFKFSDGIDLMLFASSQDLGLYEAKSSFTGAYAVLLVDINGIKTKPNVAGKDIFIFYIDRTGQVIPSGSNTEAWLRNNDTYKYSSAGSNWSCNASEVSKGFGCAGSIFENNQKVIYQ